jgi:IS5 family transposase
VALRHDDAHGGGNAESGLIHSVVCIAADEADLAQSHALLHGQESAVHGDSGYSGLDRRAEVKAAQDEGKLGRRIAWHIAMKRGQLEAMPEAPAKAMHEWFGRRKAKIRGFANRSTSSSIRTPATWTLEPEPSP